MEVESVVSLISSVGFPIVCCFFMWRFIQTTIEKFTNAMNDNTKELARLCALIERSGNDGD